MISKKMGSLKREPYIFSRKVDKRLKDKLELQKMLEEAATIGAQRAIATLFSGSLHLDNTVMTSHACNAELGGIDMREKIHVGTDENGKAIYKWASGKTKNDLLMNSVRILAEAGLLGKFLHTEESCAIKTPFEQYAKKWFSLYKEDKLRHTTVTGYMTSLNKHILPYFGNMAIEEISIDIIQAFLDTKKDYAKKTVQEIMLLLRMILDAAIDDKIIHTNPAKSKRLTIAATRKTEREPLTEKEAMDIIDHIRDLSQLRDRRLVALLLYLPVRREEILGFKTGDIDPETMMISVKRSVTFKNNCPVIGEPKTKAGYRSIPIIKELWDFLELGNEDLSNGERFLVHADNTPELPYTGIMMRRAWERISSTINVYGKTPHCFRHTFATYGKRLGIDEKTMQTIGGWKDISTLRKVYTHTQKDDIEIAREKMKSMYKTTDSKQTVATQSTD